MSASSGPAGPRSPDAYGGNEPDTLPESAIKCGRPCHTDAPYIPVIRNARYGVVAPRVMNSEPHPVVSAVTLPRPAPRARTLRLHRDPPGPAEDPVHAGEETGRPEGRPAHTGGSRVRQAAPATRAHPIPADDNTTAPRSEGTYGPHRRELSGPTAEAPVRPPERPRGEDTRRHGETPAAPPSAPVFPREARDAGTRTAALPRAAREKVVPSSAGRRVIPARETPAGSTRSRQDDLDRAPHTRYKVDKSYKPSKVVISALRPPTCDAGHVSYPNTDSLHIGVDESVL